MVNILALHNSYEVLHSRIQSNLCTAKDDLDVLVTSIDITSLRTISWIRVNSHFPNLDIPISPDDLPTKIIHLTINAIQSKATTPEEQSLGHFTRRKLNRLSTWDEWWHGEINQLNQMHELGMFGKPINAPNNEIYLRIHWKYAIKTNWNRGTIQCYDGYNRVTPMII